MVCGLCFLMKVYVELVKSSQRSFNQVNLVKSQVKNSNSSPAEVIYSCQQLISQAFLWLFFYPVPFAITFPFLWVIPCSFCWPFKCSLLGLESQSPWYYPCELQFSTSWDSWRISPPDTTDRHHGHWTTNSPATRETLHPDSCSRIKTLQVYCLYYLLFNIILLTNWMNH